MTWLSYSAKALSLFGILPLVLKQFTEADVVLWYLFSTIIIMQSLADFGFRQTFSRLISYAYKGIKEISNNNGILPNETSDDEPNEVLLNRIVASMLYIYKPLTAIVFFIMITLGTWFMYKPIGNSSNITQSWIRWVVLVKIQPLQWLKIMNYG